MATTNINKLRKEKRAEAQARIAAKAEEATIARLQNNRLMDLEAARELRQSNINKLEVMTAELNMIHSVKLAQMGEVKVNCFPVGAKYFGTEISLLLGILSTAKSTYVDEQREQVLAITGLNAALVEDTNNAIGEIAYFSKKTGVITPSILGDYETAKALIEETAEAMGMVVDISKFTEAKYAQFFNNAEKAAIYKFNEFQTSMELDATTDFTLKRV